MYSTDEYINAHTIPRTLSVTRGGDASCCCLPRDASDRSEKEESVKVTERYIYITIKFIVQSPLVHQRVRNSWEQPAGTNCVRRWQTLYLDFVYLKYAFRVTCISNILRKQ